MVYTPHTIVKPEKIAELAVTALEQRMVVPALMQREGIDQYKGTKDETINVKVEGVLPYRTYGWRNNRSTPITFDVYSERTIQVSWGDDIYSAVKVTDEQADFDLRSWTKLMVKQSEAIGRGLEYEATDVLLGAPYAVTLGGAVASRSLRGTLIRAREVLNRFMVPEEQRYFVCGTGWETALLEDTDLNLAQNVGDAEAVSALRNATLGRRYGFEFVVAKELPANFACAMVRSAFIFATGAPSVPGSVPFGATHSVNGVALRWIRDYDSEYLTDRSVVNTYKGFREVTDILVGRDSATPSQAFVSENEHFVRAIKLDLEATADVLPDPDGPDEAQQELAAITGVAGAADGAGV